MIHDFHWEDFLDLIAEMPDIEGVQEIDVRLQRVKDDRRELGNTAGAVEIREALNLEEDALRLRRKAICDRIESRKWSKAVRAIFGEEGFEKCMEWIRTIPEGEVKAIAMRRENIWNKTRKRREIP